jgi:hypothetical protein
MKRLVLAAAISIAALASAHAAEDLSLLLKLKMANTALRAATIMTCGDPREY